MKELQPLPIGIQHFESLRRDGYLYVDKTERIYQLVKSGRYYFLSRPRRFGKSLLMSTIHALFDGKKELFDGTVGQRLKIADMEGLDWEAHPVLHLDLNTERYDAKDKLEYKLNLFLCNAEALYGANEAERAIGTRFEGVIRRAYEKSGQQIISIGMNFSSETRNIEKYVVG